MRLDDLQTNIQATIALPWLAYFSSSSTVQLHRLTISKKNLIWLFIPSADKTVLKNVKIRPALLSE